MLNALDLDRPDVAINGVDPTLDDLATFFDVSLDMLCIRNLDGIVLKVSRSWETHLGYAPEDMEGRPILRLVHPDDMPATRGSVVQVESHRTDGALVGFVNRYRHKNGTYRQLEWRARRYGDKIYAVARDVTERLAQERALAEAKAAAEAANEAKSDFLANMSHEIRTPLNGVIGIVDALARTPLTDEQRELVSLIQTSGTTLERLVSDILDVSKIEAGQLDIEARPFDLLDELATTIETLRLKAEGKGLTFDLSLGEQARGSFLGDSTRIRQVVANLLSNAAKFTNKGSVALSLDVTEVDDGPVLAIEVRDTGVGFDPVDAGMLFQRFSQADASITRRFGGTGLGLAICRSLVGMMGGEITAESRPGQGSRFCVTLPLPRTETLADYDARRVAQAPVSDADVGTVPAADAQRPLRILLAEDHPTNQRVVQLILATRGAQVVTVEDGAQALAAFRDQGPFDLVLMDMQMPVMDGLTATRAIRRHETVVELA
ncbi:ATP-binding protein, partial [Brevundimonas sp.]|uniref:ATP-binding protein n=1 Tax=Brevundimonas sp. TaxID=1871086 RepID=UPI002ABB5897